MDWKYSNRKVVTKLSRNFFDEASEVDFCTLGHYYVFKNKTINPDRIEINGIEDIKEEIARMNIFLKNQEENNKCKKFIEENFTDIDVFPNNIPNKTEKPITGNNMANIKLINPVYSKTGFIVIIQNIKIAKVITIFLLILAL